MFILTFFLLFFSLCIQAAQSPGYYYEDLKGWAENVCLDMALSEMQSLHQGEVRNLASCRIRLIAYNGNNVVFDGTGRPFGSPYRPFCKDDYMDNLFVSSERANFLTRFVDLKAVDPIKKFVDLRKLLYDKTNK